MKTRTILGAVAALALNTGIAAYAQGNPTQDSIEQQRYGRALGTDRGNSRQWQRDAAPAADARRDNRPGYDRDNRQDYRRDDRRDYRRDDRAYGSRDERRGYDRHDRGEYSRYGYRQGYDGRGAGPDHSFYRGGRLPREYRDHSYVVDDWRGHHLSAPPRGYHWVQTGSDYVLAAIATGIIAQILLSQ